MNNSGNNANEQFNLKETYKTFVSQMSDWYNGGELPELAGQDLRFVLELQKQKLQSLGIDMQCTIKNTGSTQNDVSGISFGDRIFINSIVSGNMGMTRSFGSNQNQFRFVQSQNHPVQVRKPCRYSRKFFPGIRRFGHLVENRLDDR